MMIKIGLIGTGYINKVHTNAAKNVENIKITSVFSRDKKRAEKFAKEFSVQSSFDNYDEMLGSDIDAVIIGVPTPLHKEYALKAFEASKHVLCEKPIALSIEDGKEMLRRSAEAGVIFMVAQVLRFWPEYVETKNIIEKNNFGKIKSISAYRFSSVPEWSSNNWLLNPAQSGGVPVDLQIHDIDFILWLLGKPESVYAAGTLDKNLIINSKAVFQFENAVAVSEAGYFIPKDGKFQAGFKIITESAIFEYNNLLDPSLSLTNEGNPTEKINIENKNPYENQINYFAGCVENKINPERVKTREAIDSLSTCLNIKSLIEKQNK